MGGDIGLKQLGWVALQFAKPSASLEAIMCKIAIHGFGRIGRSTLKAALKGRLFVPVSISDVKDAPTLAALFEVDTNYPRWTEEVVLLSLITIGCGRWRRSG